MRQYIYKTIIAVVALIIVFEFTIGKTINKFNQKAEIIFHRSERRRISDYRPRFRNFYRNQTSFKIRIFWRMRNNDRKCD